MLLANEPPVAGSITEHRCEARKRRNPLAPYKQLNLEALVRCCISRSLKQTFLPASNLLLFPLLTFAVPITPSTNIISLSNSLNDFLPVSQDFSLDSSLALPFSRQRLTSRISTDILSERQLEVQTLDPGATIYSIFAGGRGLNKHKFFNAFESTFRTKGGRIWDLNFLDADGITVDWEAPPLGQNMALPNKGRLPWPSRLEFFDAERILKACTSSRV